MTGEIVNEVLNNLQQTLVYEANGVKARWQRRQALIQKVKSRFQSLRTTIMAEEVTPKGAIHYTYKIQVTKKGVHY